MKYEERSDSRLCSLVNEFKIRKKSKKNISKFFRISKSEDMNIKKSPFHPFSLIDTVSLGVLATRQTVLARICKELNIPYDDNEAHSATYDANVTAQVFCKIFNQYDA